MKYAEETIQLKAIFTSLIEALELADPYTRGHSERVGTLSVSLGLELGLSTRELDILQDAGTLHDIGKIGVDSRILHKPGPLTEDEFAEIRKHPVYGYNILKPLCQQELLDITLMHHERMDGKGYPNGITDYPLLVRVLQIADVWDALSSNRPYRKAMPYGRIRRMMDSSENAFGFDPDLLDRFLALTTYIFPDDEPLHDNERRRLSPVLVGGGRTA
ncbi:MAG: HD-GYP domain-containing protein [bacterium]|nr:HD-GYP domain-containing protein [bacterium]